jgi:NAD(P)-dependent dehydrogenase (short-subunit alcohol dehydrogenase family)
LNMKRLLEDQVAIVTGGARGIAQRLVQDGCRIVLWDCNLSTFDAKDASFSPALVYNMDVKLPNSLSSILPPFLRAAVKPSKIMLTISDAFVL